MNTNAMWGGAMLVGILAALGRQLQACLRRLAGLCVERMHVDNDNALAIALHDHNDNALAIALHDHLFAGGVASRIGDRHYFGEFYHVRSVGAQRIVPVEALGHHGAFFRVGRWPVYASLTPRAARNTGDSPGTAGRDDAGLQLVALRGTVDLDRLVAEACARCSGAIVGRRRRRFVIHAFAGRAARRRHSAPARGDDAPQIALNEMAASASSVAMSAIPHGRVVGYDPDDIGDPLPKHGKALDAVALPPEADDAIADVRRWVASRDWYEERAIPWRYGVLFHGPPGNGKSTAVRALAQDLDLPVYAFDLGSMDNEEFANYWRAARNDAPCIVLFEDFDRVFDGRVNVALPDGGVTFPSFLNALSGVDVPSGVLTIITTNRPETLDAAICAIADGAASRPGRIDRAVRVGPPGEDQRRRIATRICAGLAHLVDDLVEEGDGDSGAQFEDRCRTAALSAFWRAPLHREATRCVNSTS